MLKEIISGGCTIVGLIVRRLESKDRTDVNLLSRFIIDNNDSKIQENHFKATPEMIKAVSEDNCDDDAMLNLLLIYIMER